MSWRSLRASSALVAATTAFSAFERLPRSTGIIRILATYQPKNGIHTSSRFKM